MRNPTRDLLGVLVGTPQIRKYRDWIQVPGLL
jgi:hypothetical protein